MLTRTENNKKRRSDSGQSSRDIIQIIYIEERERASSESIASD